MCIMPIDGLPELACNSEPWWHQMLFGCGCVTGLLPIFGTVLIAIIILAIIFFIYAWKNNKQIKGDE